MSTMERILRLMADKKASDVYLAVNSPVLIKINGECIPVNSQLLPVDGPRSLLAEIVTPRDMETLQETGELNIGVPCKAWGGFVSVPCTNAAPSPWSFALFRSTCPAWHRCSCQKFWAT